MADAAVRPLRAFVEARPEEIKAVVARHEGRSVAIFDENELDPLLAAIRRSFEQTKIRHDGSKLG